LSQVGREFALNSFLLGIESKSMARYPQIRVSLDSANPMALVSKIRLELRRAGVGRLEIQQFSGEALTLDDPEGIREVCSQWVGIRFK
jgi:hypothetical protein